MAWQDAEEQRNSRLQGFNFNLRALCGGKPFTETRVAPVFFLGVRRKGTTEVEPSNVTVKRTLARAGQRLTEKCLKLGQIITEDKF